MADKAQHLSQRLTKAIRVRGDGARRTFHVARRAARFLRDMPRRAALRSLPATSLEIPRREGYLLRSPGSFEEVPAIVADAHAALARFEAGAGPAGNAIRKRFLVNVLDASSLTPESAVVRFALRDDVVAAVSRYLGTVPCLSTITVFHSDTVEGTPKSSQLHHCDGDDLTQVKIFIYCSDVDMASGPLTVLGAEDSARVQGDSLPVSTAPDGRPGRRGPRAAGRTAHPGTHGHDGVRGHQPLLPLRIARGARGGAAPGDDDSVPDALQLHDGRRWRAVRSIRSAVAPAAAASGAQ